MARKRAKTSATQDLHHTYNGGNTQTPKVSGYEQFREERIKANLERMQKLGILDLSLQLKSIKTAPKSTPFARRTPHRPSILPPSGPTRRSSRLQNVTPVSYSEVKPPKKDDSLENGDGLLRREGSKPEIYTEEHDKLLGSTEQNWTLFVDGCGKDGKRIYDPVNGKTCHQCRQKTLGHRTCCSKCNMVQGQFCGDCLYMRYGEHVLEAKQNPNWICPVCRGICNCSLCRQAKGWPPTGSLYRKISSLGYKSVAHYLIQTRRAETGSDTDLSTKVPVSAKRSLPFEEMEISQSEKGLPDSNNNPLDLVNADSDVAKSLPFEEMEISSSEKGLPDSNNNPLDLVNADSDEAKSIRNYSEGIGQQEHCSADEKVNCKLASERTEPLLKPELDSDCGDELQRLTESESNGPRYVLQNEKDKQTQHLVDNEHSHCDFMNKSEEPLMKPVLKQYSSDHTSVPMPVPEEEKIQKTPGSNSSNEREDLGQMEMNGGTMDISQVLNSESFLSEADMDSSIKESSNDPTRVPRPGEDKAQNTPGSKRKRAPTTVPVADSIAGRLRERRIKHNDTNN